MKFWLQCHDRMTYPSCVWDMSVQKLSLYLTENTLYVYDKEQTINAVQGDSCCLLWKWYEMHKYILQAKYRAAYYSGYVLKLSLI